MIYVDRPIYKYGRMMMCHMVGDTTDELLDMATKIGVNQKWIQKSGTPSEHFDVCVSKRSLAIKLGAMEVTSRDLVNIIKRKRLSF